MDNDSFYEIYQAEKFEEFEAMCKQCGICCGATDGDPCANLAYDNQTKKYYCLDYDARLGIQKTISGKTFNCVTIREVIRDGGLRPECAYSTSRLS